MKTRSWIVSLGLSFTFLCLGENAADPVADPVLDAIQEFNHRDDGKTNEVSVVLDPPETPSEPEKETAAEDQIEQPVRVVGTPSEVDDVEKVTVESPAKPKDGLVVRVEKYQSGELNIAPNEVKLLAPFPAKPLSSPPKGWRLEKSDSAPAFTREIEISPGTKITLDIHPHLLIPEADGVESFSVPEPGYNAAAGYKQITTVGAILASSIRQLDDHSKQLGAALDNLQQLLVSLPKRESVPPTDEPLKPLK